MLESDVARCQDFCGCKPFKGSNARVSESSPTLLQGSECYKETACANVHEQSAFSLPFREC